MTAVPLVDAKIRAHTRLVNEAIAARLPRLDGRFAASMREYLDRGNTRVRPSFAVYEPMRRVVTAGGKRIRPTLCLIASEAVGGKVEHALPTAVGIEFLHTFTLVHDDICDKALTRRGDPTVGALWGDEVALTVGDALFAIAMRAFAENARVPGVDAERALRVIEDATDTSVKLAQGQALDLLYAERDDVTTKEYMEMIHLKTGVLLEFSLHAGARLGGADEDTIRAVTALGAPLGIAFQVRDDVLDLTGDPAVTGKPVGGDVRTGKRTLIVAHALEHATERAELARILNAPPERTTDADVARAIRILEDAGSVRYAESVAEEHVREAKAALANLPETPGGDALATLAHVAEHVLTRQG